MSVFSCKDMVRLASAALDRALTVGQRLALHTHLLMCSACTRFRKHLQFLRAAASILEDPSACGGVERATLSPEARDRIQRALDQGNDERTRHAGFEP